jgi:hypothetical protein
MAKKKSRSNLDGHERPQSWKSVLGEVGKTNWQWSLQLFSTTRRARPSIR